ncbi:Gmad2 immunoglobulin-like domain-containing protein [Brevibacillus sp. GCM10020057]|uniref:Gmad2 immunoglobulin-like domain-containing protein n=1 Tax=Brevibacillus sp. GCM10020057 TaxID=3317327 RepID=UPI003636DA6C
MKKACFLLLTVFLLQGCTGSGQGNPAVPANQEKPPASAPENPQPPSSRQPPIAAEPSAPPEQQPTAEKAPPEYANDIFQKVTVRKTGPDTFEVKGQARVFEAVVSYVVEDGHNELARGSIQASAGAPAWGDFSRTIQVKKAQQNSTLTLILFETSPKDGSRRMELIIPLPEH